MVFFWILTGPLGFMSFQDENDFVEGNQGLKDQQLALMWIQNNIEKFGGDKDKVTEFCANFSTIFWENKPVEKQPQLFC